MHQSKLLSLTLIGTLLSACAFAQDSAPSEKKKGGLTIIDAQGKERSVSAWKFSQGTRHLTWLAPAPKENEPEPKEKTSPPIPRGAGPRRQAALPAVGPVALALRETDSTTFAEGILTLIPLQNLASVEYDSDNRTVEVRVAGPDGESPITLTGSTKYKGINKLVIQAEVDRGEMGVAEITYQGGSPNGIQGLKFTSPKSAPAPEGKKATLTINDGKKTKVEVTNLSPIYQLASGLERSHNLLMFKKTFKVKMTDLKKLVNTSDDALDAVCRIVLTDETDEMLTLLRTIEIDGKPAEFRGFVGRVPAGYKLFPIHTIVELEMQGE